MSLEYLVGLIFGAILGVVIFSLVFIVGFLIYLKVTASKTKKQKFILINDKGRIVRAKVLVERNTYYKVVTMDDHDDGAVDLNIAKNDPRIFRVYEE